MLNLTSTIGLVLFLFLVGLEIDVRMVKRNAKASMIISAAGLIVPLGLGAALGVPIYNQFISPDVNFGYFVLFTAVAIGITAFPVLCRILTELKLLDTTVGVVVLSAGVGNDVSRYLSSFLSLYSSSFSGRGVDSPCSNSRSCQCRKWADCSLGSPDCSWIRYIPLAACSMGIPLARSLDW